MSTNLARKGLIFAVTKERQEMNVRECIPKDKHDLLALERARELGFPLLNEIIPDLLEWLQDGNWPVARPTATLLAEAGQEIVPYIKDIMADEDGSWKYFVIELLVSNLSHDLRSKLRSDLLRLANQPTQNDKYEDACNTMSHRRGVFTRICYPNCYQIQEAGL